MREYVDGARDRDRSVSNFQLPLPRARVCVCVCSMFIANYAIVYEHRIINATRSGLNRTETSRPAWFHIPVSCSSRLALKRVREEMLAEYICLYMRVLVFVYECALDSKVPEMCSKVMFNAN